MKSLVKYLLFAAILIAGVTLLAVYWTFWKPLPDYSATHNYNQLQDDVQIHWDAYGVPHIYADNLEDLYFSIGHVHAQDRLWQMTLSQMAGEGRLAEFFGEEVVEYDIFQRTIGFWQTAKKMEKSLSDSSRVLLQHYADGVNAYVRNNPDKLPIQFSLVGMQPIRWTVTHTLALARMMAWDLNIAWKNELTFAYLGEHLDRDSFAELMPQNKYLSQLLESYSGDSYTASALLPILQIDQKWRHLMQFENFGAGSNAWAVGPGKTQSSYPLLAGDPHLGLSMPGKWYEVHLSWNGRNLSGATLAGSPAVILGQNDSLAWSFTNLMLDDTDFFVEALNPENPREYILDSLAGEPVMDRLQLQRQLIRIRNRPDSVFIRRLTKHGPVVSDIYPDEKLVSDRVVAMRWTGHEVSNEFEALLGMNWAGNMQEFQRHLPSFRVPGQNVIYADKNGNIARFSMARIPLRSG
ncbi:MAG: penicillin acylase family protein, partial [Balneolaceae bacterium]|nr:penicillin acylase family protein [Balneolaceae bacterium]